MDEHDDTVSDADLVQRLRAGDREAAVDLWTRHYPAVLLAARRVTRQQRDAEEIASDAFSGMLSALASGAGPSASVRAYLVTSVRNLAASRATRSSASDVMTDDVALFDRPTLDTTAHMTELQLVRVAFAELPKRWQVVLWRTAVDKDSNIEVGEAMGLSANAVAALAKRARRGFRLSYLRAHLSDRGVEAQCKPFIDGLADLSISEADAPPALVAHVASCVHCTRRLDELRAVNLNFAGVVGPAVLALVPSKLLLGAAASGAGAALATTGAGVGAVAGGSAGAGGGPALASGADVGLRTAWGSNPGARWALGSTAVASAVAAILLASGPGQTTPPPVAGPFTTTPSPTTTSARPPTTTAPTTTTPAPAATSPAPSRPSSPAPAPAPTPASPRLPGAPRTPQTSPQPTRSTAPATTTAPRTSPLTVDLALAGPAASTTIQVAAAAEGIRGPVRLVLELPDGVTLSGATGDWSSCHQDGTTVRCVAAASSAGRWSGTVTTAWVDGARGRVRATVSGTYATGSPATGSVGTTWPP